jgi:hypothetical protein
MKRALQGVTLQGSLRRRRPTFARCTIIGPKGLTAVFGMGTGVTPWVWSPTNLAAGPLGHGEDLTSERTDD